MWNLEVLDSRNEDIFEPPNVIPAPKPPDNMDPETQ
jgi:hypothetical protein